MDYGRIQTIALVIIAFAVVLFLLVQARFMLIALATAIIIFALTSDVINFIARQKIGRVHVPNWLASLGALLLISLALIVLSTIFLTQVNTVLSTTISYLERAPQAVATLFKWISPEAEQTILNSLSSINISSYVRTFAGQAGNLASGISSFTVLVILFVGFLFAERVWFDTKLNNLVGDPVQADKIRRIITSIIRRVNYYLLVKTVVSVVTGGMVFAVAKAFKLDLASALGVLTFVLNYIPNVGSIIATVMVALVAFVQTGDPTSTGAIFVITGAIQFVNGSILDPMMMGHALRVSSFGIIISLAFWGAVWGIPGMFLSVPIMVMLMVVCSHVPMLRPIAVLLSRQGLPDDESDLIANDL
ncbi:AI-2E family transporter [Marivivens sp. LCG002]|uniref:AI-2E family transporter n=1 Tax=Marivivens sp. LCG002 TaxID=3051171 RepID=UPI0025574157|nr:AI-2E family transporter [Marivivens sp. LCG002]WIV52212.1 AI-2E family transporter [Marivivens sp. LCG002]